MISRVRSLMGDRAFSSGSPIFESVPGVKTIRAAERAVVILQRVGLRQMCDLSTGMLISASQLNRMLLN